MSHPPPDPRRWRVLVLLGVAQFMVILDVTVVNVALPSIGSALSFAAGDLHWVVTAYVLFTGGLMLLGGRLGDLLGARRVFLVGLGVFTAASLFSGAAWSPGSLVAGRAVQGVGAALLLPSALALVATTYTGRQRAVALGVWGAIGSAGAAVGVLLGGVITTALSWEWIFFVNVPIGVAVAAAVPRVVPAAAAARRTGGQFDLLGAGSLLGGLATGVYAIVGTADHGWGSTRTLALMALAALLLLAFAQIERTGARPLVPPSTWRARSLTAGAVVMLGATGILVGAFFLNTLLLQHALDASALETGLAFLPLALVILVAAHLASHLFGRFGTRPVMAGGLLLTAAGALLLSRAPADAGYVADLLPGFVAVGFGMGLTFVSVSVAAMQDVEHEQAGLASGVMTTGHELGAAIGVAILASVATAGTDLRSAVDLADGYGDAFVLAGAIAVALALVALVAVPSVRPAAGQRLAMH